MNSIAEKIKNHCLYPEYLNVRRKLAAHQFICWIAGGAVRDFYLGRTVVEFDLVTDATTEVLKMLFPQAVLVGESFGVIKLPLAQNEFFDLATFREEADYLDGRRPSLVKASTPTKDSVRRDFTINAMFWDDIAGCIRDYQSGLLDIELKKIKCVGDARVRFSEDYLRIVRLVRFAAQLDFKIEDNTLNAATEFLPKVDRVSGERVWSELNKIDKSRAWSKALDQKLFFPLIETVFKCSIQRPFCFEADLNKVDLFMMLNLLFKEDLSNVLKTKLKISNIEIECYKQTRFWLYAATNRKVEELAFESEKSNLLFENLKRLVEAKLVNATLLENINEILKLNIQVLITAKELVNLIPNQFISFELREIRLGQFGKIYKTKGEVLAYLKKKYALKNQET